MGTKTVSTGFWTCEAGINFGVTLPNGVTIGANGGVSVGGESSVTVEGGVKGSCSLGQCRMTTLRVGPGFKTIGRKVPIIKMCYFGPPDPETHGWDCSEENKDACDPILFYKSCTLTYLAVACQVYGGCGFPYDGGGNCPECENPQSPTCPE